MERLGKHFFKKMQIKTLIFQRYILFFVLILFLFTNSCSRSVENCRFSPDYLEISESAIKNYDSLTETEWQSVLMSCSF